MNMSTMSPQDVLAMMDSETERAAKVSSGGVPTFLWMKGNAKALVRPLVDLGLATVMKMHSRYNQANPQQSINAVCAGQGCQHCVTVASAARDDKEARKLTANVSFMLPVYLYALKQKNAKTGIWEDMTYTDPDNVAHPVSGFRVLELISFGAINDVFQFLRTYRAENEPHDISVRDFAIERIEQGAKPTITYVTIPKDARPMSEQVRVAIPAPGKVYELVAAARPPVLAGSLAAGLANPFVNVPAQNGGAVSLEGIPDF